jgi:Protein of unknown function (DUF1559)
MHFANVVVICSLVLLAPLPCFAQAKQPQLVEFDSQAVGDPNIAMHAKELKREEKTSTIQIVRTKKIKASAVEQSMFAVRAIYEVAKARKCEYFVNLKEWTDKDGSQIYIAGFTNEKDADLKKEFGDEYSYENEFGQKRKFLSISQFGVLFERQPRQIPTESRNNSQEDDAQTRQATMDQMHSIGLAMHRYLDEHKTFPPPALVDGDGQPLLSWRVAILSYFKNDDCIRLWRKFHLDERWSSEHNRALIAQMPAVYRCAKSKLADRGMTVYQVPHEPSTVFSGPGGIPMRMIIDGASRTIGVVEVDEAHAVPWTRPDDLAYDPADPARGLGGHFEDVFIIMALDAQAHAVPKGIEKDELRGLFTYNGFEDLKF